MREKGVKGVKRAFRTTRLERRLPCLYFQAKEFISLERILQCRCITHVTIYHGIFACTVPKFATVVYKTRLFIHIILNFRTK